MIDYPLKPMNEAEIQATLWYRLRQFEIDARLEVKANHARPDITLFFNKTAIGIIECKSWSLNYLRKQKYQRSKNSKQITKYKEMFGLPIFICGCVASIEPAIQFASRLVKNHHG